MTYNTLMCALVGAERSSSKGRKTAILSPSTRKETRKSNSRGAPCSCSLLSARQGRLETSLSPNLYFTQNEDTVQHQFFPALSLFSGKMRHIVKNISSHPLYFLEKENEMQTNDVLSAVSRGNMLN